MEHETIVPDLCEGDIIKRHKQEKKDLQAKIQGMKKSVPKGDKKKKKEIADEIAKLEDDLEKRHSEELKTVQSSNIETITSEVTVKEPEVIEENDEEDSRETISQRVSRAQKRRLRKAAEEKERQKRISEQAEKNKSGPRELEMRSIKENLRTMNLNIFNIPADGNCLYCAVNHQLEIKGKPTYSVSELRKITAEFMLKNREDFLPFMCNEMDEDETVTEEEFEKYCKDVANTKLWGGQLELKALSNILSCPIKIIQANGPPTIQGEGFEGPELILTYHRYLYRLGEHYNSTLHGPRTDDDDDDVC